jgi:dihydroflavonol-4-reductase
MTLEQVLAALAVLTGLPAPYGKVPSSLALAVAAVSELVEGRLLRRHPSVPLEAARMSTSRMSFDISRARAELGYAPRPAVEALEASARWFVEAGMVRESRESRIRWANGR